MATFENKAAVVLIVVSAFFTWLSIVGLVVALIQEKLKC